MKKEANSNYVELKHYPGFEIEEEFPHIIRNIKTKEEVPLKKTASGFIAKFDENTKEYIQQIVARQFLYYEKGDEIIFEDDDKLNYDVCNMDVIKKNKNGKIDESIFTDNEYSLNEFREEVRKTKKLTYIQIKQKIQRCVAVLPNGFAVKLREENGVRYNIIKRSNINDIFGFNLTFNSLTTVTDEVGNSEQVMKPTMKKCKVIIEAIENDLIFFDGVRHVGFSDRFLNMYRPPTGKYIEGLPEKIIKFFEDRLHYPSALHELLSSHAYRFRHSNTFIEKFFIHFSKESTTGKSLLAAILGTMYPRYANLGASPDQLESKFNGWMQDYLMIQIEELQNENYRNHTFEGVMKRFTTKHGSGQKKGVDTTACENCAIVGCNTNKPDLYGLINAPEAERVRMVILWFKEKPKDLIWDDFKTEIGMNDATCSEQDKSNLGYTLYYYLRYKYTIKKDFSVTKYFDKDRDEIIQKLQQLNKSHFNTWLSQLKFVNQDETSEHHILERKKDKQKNEYVAIPNNQRLINESFRKYRRDFECETNYKPTTLIDMLLNKGFHAIKSNGTRYLRISKDEFEKLIKFDVDDIPEDDMEDGW